MATILSRSTWTSTSASGAGFTWSRIRGLVCHYPAAGKDIGVISASAEQAKFRGWRNYHVNGRGWADIGYNYGITQAGRIYSLRGNRVGAHCSGHNSTSVGVLFMVGDNEALTAEAKKAFKSLRAYLRNQGAGSGVWGHQQMSGASTRCPGPYIMSDIRDGSLKAGTGGGAATPGSGGGGGGGKYESPSAKHKVGSRAMGMYDGGTDVNWYQRRMYKIGYDVTPKKDGTFDSLFGTEMDKFTRQLQEKAGIAVDGLAGEDTIAAARAADVVRDLPKTSSKPKPKPSKPKTSGKLTVDGKWGTGTTKALQRLLGTPVDGEVSFQPKAFEKENPGLLSGWKWTNNPRSSNMVEALQRKLGVSDDGRIGPNTIKALQRKLGTPVDGKVSNPSAMVKQLQRNLNAGKLW